MTRLAISAAFAIGAVAVIPLSLQGQGQSQPVRVCSLLSKEEVKKHLPWNAVLDQMAPEEEPIGPSGSSCNYPSVMIQVIPFTRVTVDALRKKGVETIAGLGDEAYFHNNRGEYAELYVRVGTRALTVQANVDDDMSTAKTGAVNLAKALVARLR